MALNQSTEFQTADTAQSVLIWTSGLDQKYDFFNQGWLDFTGSQLHQNINEGWLEFIHPDDLNSFRDTYQNAYVTENPFQFEYRLKRRDGRYRWILCNAIPRPNLAGEFSGYIATNIEVPDQQEEEPEQTAIKEHFELVLNYITDGIWDWIDVETDEQWWSPHFYELIGYQDQEIEPGFETFKRLLYPEDLQRTLQALNDTLDKNTPFDIEFRLRIKGGEYHWFRGYAKVQRNSYGRAVRMTGSISDIHQRILAEKQLKESRKQADQAIKFKDAFLSMMGHEIRTPLTSILGFSEILIESSDNPDTLNAADIIHTNGEYLLNTINDFLDLSKIENGQLEIEILECCPLTVIENAQAFLKKKAESKNMDFEIDYENELPEIIKSDPIRLKQILLNVVGIAIRYTDSGSVKLGIKTTTVENGTHHLTFTVSNTGMGMTSELLNHLFSPFQLSDVSMPDFGDGTGLGLGLGLTISKQFIEMLGGSISVDHQDESGTTIEFSIATGDISEVKMEKVTAAMRLQEVKSHKLTHDLIKQDCRILLVEDGIYNQRLIKFLLKKAEAEVTIVENGRQAIEELLKSQAIGDPLGDQYDLILMDIQMPVLDGYATTRKLRSMGFSKPIIALTAHAMYSDRKKCFDAGCDEYLTKPIDRNKLINVINSVMKVGTQKHLVTK